MALTWSRSIEWDVDDWRDQAACTDTDPDLFFPSAAPVRPSSRWDRAKAVCTQCNAQRSCLEFALSTNQESGIWGGASEEERRKLRKAWLAAQRKASSIPPWARRSLDAGPFRARTLDIPATLYGNSLGFRG